MSDKLSTILHEFRNAGGGADGFMLNLEKAIKEIKRWSKSKVPKKKKISYTKHPFDVENDKGFNQCRAKTLEKIEEG